MVPHEFHNIYHKIQQIMKNTVKRKTVQHANLILSFEITITNSLLMSQVRPQIFHWYRPLQTRWRLRRRLESWTKWQRLCTTSAHVINRIIFAVFQWQECYKQLLQHCYSAAVSTHNHQSGHNDATTKKQLVDCLAWYNAVASDTIFGYKWLTKS